jgi:hypothetical protein
VTPATERWINDRLSECGLGPVSRDEDFWAQMWAHALNAADGATPALQHRMARHSMVRAVETLYFGRPITDVTEAITSAYEHMMQFDRVSA